MTTPENIGKYIDLDLIGQGGFGIVYKAWDPDLDRPVAIKVMRPQFAQDESWVTQFRDEAMIFQGTQMIICIINYVVDQFPSISGGPVRAGLA